MAVDKARGNNMPSDNIKRAIARAGGAGGEKEIEELRYEGYGPAGVAVIVELATDNRNRTAADLRHIFSRSGGTLGETGSVGWMFEPRGLIEVETGGANENDLTERALVDGVIDVRYPSDAHDPAEILTEPNALAGVRERLIANGMHVTSMVLGVEATTKASPMRSLPAN